MPRLEEEGTAGVNDNIVTEKALMPGWSFFDDEDREMAERTAAREQARQDAERKERERQTRLKASFQNSAAFVMPEFPAGVQPNTDAANAEILSANGLSERLRYTKGLGWLVYQPNRGVWDSSPDQPILAKTAGEVLRGAVGQHLATLIAEKAGRAEIDRAFGWSKQVGSNRVVLAALEVAAGLDEFRTDSEDWDAQPHLLNCRNGVLDLNTRELIPHRPDQLLTWQAGAIFDRKAKHHYVDQLLELLRQDGREESLKRFFGSCLWGENPNERLVILEGEGGTGKGTLLNGILKMMGNYAQPIEVNLLLANSHGESSTGAKPELLGLRKKRLVVTGEPPKGARFNAGRVKGMTGNDPITARRMRSNDMVTFYPTAKIAIHTNYPIHAPHDDSGLQRRVLVIPFKAKPVRNEEFKKVIESDPAAQSALLNWTLEGFTAWRENGFDLGISAEVQRATQHYWQTQNPYEQFIQEKLTFNSGGEILSGRLTQLWDEWRKEQGNQSARDVKFAELTDYLKSQGAVNAKGSKGIRKWIGVAGVADQPRITLSEPPRMALYGVSAPPPPPAPPIDDVALSNGWEGDEL